MKEGSASISACDELASAAPGSYLSNTVESQSHGESFSETLTLLLSLWVELKAGRLMMLFHTINNTEELSLPG